jgi:hypothetical protein
VTDFDVGVEGEAHAAVTAEAVLATFSANIEKLRLLLASAVRLIGEPPARDTCQLALEGSAT